MTHKLKALTDPILDVPNKVNHFILTVEKLRWKRLTPETATKISDANEEIVKKKPGRARLLGTSLNILNNWQTSLYQFLIVLCK